MSLLTRPIIKKIISVAFVCVLVFGCQNPFFPMIDVPTSNPPNLQTPEGVIAELVRAYENKRLSLFQKLIYDNAAFKFYIQANPSKLLNLNHINKSHIEYLTHSFVVNDNYLYLDYGQEYRIHENLFNSKNKLTFTDPLTIESISYPTLQQFPDTVDAIVRTDKASLTIISDVLVEYKDRTAEFNLSRQIFHLKKDSQGNWRIYQWYEVD
ncbi:MAG: hypothetical protein JW795_14805 [Chitinivibrionales bacterium]|nr:hypothetical protein [Chitinivibrionales bacterium]